MLIRKLLIAGLIALSSVSFAVAQGTPVKYEGELRAIYPKLDIALRAKNLKNLTAYYDDKYTLLSDGKTLDKAAAVDQRKSVLDYLVKVNKLVTHIDKVTLLDGKYALDYTQSSSGTVRFPQSPVMPFTYDSKITDTWTRDEKGVWKTVSSVEHVSDFKVNGESAKPPGN